jgi:hypothetical protein
VDGIELDALARGRIQQPAHPLQVRFRFGESPLDSVREDGFSGGAQQTRQRHLQFREKREQRRVMLIHLTANRFCFPQGGIENAPEDAALLVAE